LIIKLIVVAIIFLILDWIVNPDKMFFKMENWTGYIGVSIYFIGEFIWEIYDKKTK